MPVKVGVVIQCFNEDDSLVERTLHSLYEQAEIELEIVLWSARVFSAGSGPGRLSVVVSNETFLDSIPSSLSTFENCKWIFICRAGVVLQPTCMANYLGKTAEYEDDSPLTAVGVRLFPCEPLQSKRDFREGLQWKVYDESREDRTVHLLTTDFCCISLSTLKKVSTFCFEKQNFEKDLWSSFVIGYHLKLPIWKVKTEGIVMECYRKHPLPISAALYDYLYTVDWPKGISTPYIRNLSTCKLNVCSPLQLWEQGFGGVNMPLHPASELDFAAAAAYGVTVIRVGAVCDASDLKYLLDPNSKTTAEDERHLAVVLPKLKLAIQKAARYGLKAIITLTDLPGSAFHSQGDKTSSMFWESLTCRERAAKFWGSLASGLADVKQAVMGYDLINEPFTPEDQEVDYFDDIPTAHKLELNQFYLMALKEIRRYDSETTIVVKCTWFASPRAMNMLTPLPDPNVAYSFHAYISPHLTFPRKFRSFRKLSYPGHIPRWIHYTGDTVLIDYNSLQRLLQDTVYKWQVKHGIPPCRILAAELGICREVPGSQQYLSDLIALFTEFKWSWLLFSFRDEEWDAMDYELGPDMENTLNRSPNEMFLTAAKHFH